jgi:hypothetical protein
MDRPTPKRRHTALVALALVTFLVARLLERPAHHATRPIEGGAASQPTMPVGPTRVLRGVPEGWRHDRAGALAAAASATHLTGAIAKAGFITRGDMIHQVATARYAPRLAEASNDELTSLLGDAGEHAVTPSQLLWDEIPLTATVAGYSPDAAAVRVWTVLVAGAPNVGVPQQAWRTVTVTLRWQAGDWKVDGWSAAAGPTPQLPDGSASAGFSTLMTVTGWPLASTVAGGS